MHVSPWFTHGCFGKDARSPFSGRSLLGVALLMLLLAASMAPALAQSTDGQANADLEPLGEPVWTVALGPVTSWSQADMSADAIGTVRPLSPLEVLGYAGEWA